MKKETICVQGTVNDIKLFTATLELEGWTPTSGMCCLDNNAFIGIMSLNDKKFKHTHITKYTSCTLTLPQDWCKALTAFREFKDNPPLYTTDDKVEIFDCNTKIYAVRNSKEWKRWNNPHSLPYEEKIGFVLNGMLLDKEWSVFGNENNAIAYMKTIRYKYTPRLYSIYGEPIYIGDTYYEVYNDCLKTLTCSSYCIPYERDTYFTSRENAEFYLNNNNLIIDVISDDNTPLIINKTTVYYILNGEIVEGIYTSDLRYDKIFTHKCYAANYLYQNKIKS